jgi:hypothetical protein
MEPPLKDDRPHSTPGDKGKTREQTQVDTSPSDDYNAFHVYYHGGPDHEGVFLEIHGTGDKAGHPYHVTGNILNGMSYDPRREGYPDDAAEFHKEHRIGRVKHSGYAQVDLICRRISVPGKQTDLCGRQLDKNKPKR